MTFVAIALGVACAVCAWRWFCAEYLLNLTMESLTDEEMIAVNCRVKQKAERLNEDMDARKARFVRDELDRRAKR